MLLGIKIIQMNKKIYNYIFFCRKNIYLNRRQGRTGITLQHIQLIKCHSWRKLHARDQWLRSHSRCLPLHFDRPHCMKISIQLTQTVPDRPKTSKGLYLFTITCTSARYSLLYTWNMISTISCRLSKTIFSFITRTKSGKK